MKKTIYFVVLAAILSLVTFPSNAQHKLVEIEDFYFGVHTGMPVAEADYSSFGGGRLHPSWDVGVNVGYRLTDMWSVEFTTSWGQFFMQQQDCCLEREYILGSDHNRYFPDLFPGYVEDGKSYEDLKSRTFAQRYGIMANVNILGLFNMADNCPWRLELSPAVYAVGSCSDILSKEDNVPFIENVDKWHFGYGGQISASYAIRADMNVGVYGGYTQLTGKPFCGMPKLHSTNYIVDAGIKLTVSIEN